MWIPSLKPDNNFGYIFEIDYYIPKEKHDLFKNYPLGPERKQVNGKQLSKYQRGILREQFLTDFRDENLTNDEVEDKINSYSSSEKLILDLEPKQKYIIHYRTLQLYLQLGIEMTHIHRILRFKQQPWLAPYIQANTEMRRKATNEFEKDFFKLMNNAFFGKTMENVRKRRLIDLVQTPEQLKKLTAQPTFKSITVFHDELSAVERMKPRILLDKPIYIGLCVLEMSKWLMYDFYYNVLQNIFTPDSMQLLFTDTDSLCISIEGYNNVYQTIYKSNISDGQPAINCFDLSGYPMDHIIFNGLNKFDIKRLKLMNKKVPGKMKDELNGDSLLEFVGLRAKAYAYRKLSGNIISEEKKLKGIQKCVVKKNVNFDQYCSSLFMKTTHMAATCSLRSHRHEIRTLAINKVATGPYDDKRYLLDDGINSLPYGHYLLQRVQTPNKEIT